MKVRIHLNMNNTFVIQIGCSDCYSDMLAQEELAVPTPITRGKHEFYFVHIHE
jgi:hypothetical protein